MNLIIAGTRSFNDYELLERKVHDFLYQLNFVTKNLKILSGKARGADTLGEDYAWKWDLDVLEFPADWDTWGKSAGYKRNVEMANCADALIAFWDGKSKGTKHMIDIAMKKSLIIKVVMV